VPVVDASAMVTAGHLAHSYAHVSGTSQVDSKAGGGADDEWSKAVLRGGKRERDVWEKMRSAEIDDNFRLAQGEAVKLGTTDHATWVAQSCPG
jgi:hypothetical protein